MIFTSEIASSLRLTLDQLIDDDEIEMASSMARSINGWVDQQALAILQHQPAPLQIATVAAVSTAALGWMIARRNLLAGSADDVSWLQMLREWIGTFVMQLFAKPEEA